jgi:death-on-curing protein
MTVFLTVEAVIGLHDSESSAPVTDRGKLEGAVGRPSSGFDGHLVHVTIWAQASALMHGIDRAQAFENGNKRAAWLSTDTFLRLNGLKIRPMPKAEMVSYSKKVARHIVSESDTALWLSENCVPLD